jgi:hypothetical protein
MEHWFRKWKGSRRNIFGAVMREPGALRSDETTVSRI